MFFLFSINDPKRNRNRSKSISLNENEKNHSFAADGAKSAYLIVKKISNGKELMCRSSKSGNETRYSCIAKGATTLEVY